MTPRASRIPLGTGKFRRKTSTWVCRWEGCPDHGHRFTSAGASLRDIQRHHLLVHGVLPNDQDAADRARRDV